MNAQTVATMDRARLTAGLLSVDELAKLLNCSARHCYRMADAGRLPRPVKLGSLVRWRAEEIAEWIAAGCPSSAKGGRQ